MIGDKMKTYRQLDNLYGIVDSYRFAYYTEEEYKKAISNLKKMQDEKVNECIEVIEMIEEEHLFEYCTKALEVIKEYKKRARL